MKRILLLVAFLFLLNPDSKGNDVSGNDDISSGLQSLADNFVGTYRQKIGLTDGGIFIALNTPTGDYMVSNNLNQEFNPDYHFRIASCTKTFTAASIMYLHQQGKLDINSKITDLIPGTNEPYIPNTAEFNIPNKSDITIKLLLEHRAGVFDVSNTPIPNSVNQPYAGKLYTEYILDLPGNYNHTFTFDELVGVVAENNLSYFLPDAGYHYSNTGYCMLGKIIERVSGLSYGAFLEANYLYPDYLNSTRAPYKGTDVELDNPHLDSYLYSSGSMKNTTLQNMSAHVAEGNLISTPNNLMKWVKMLLKGETVLDTSTIAMMKKVIPTGGHGGQYGLGLSYIEGLGYGHNGAHESFLTFMFYNPDNDITTLVGCNFWDVDNLMDQLETLIQLAIKAVEVYK